MQDPNAIIIAFQDYANSLNSGYLKTWKASSMIMTLFDFRLSIITDGPRLFSYLTNCLEMEGFRTADVEKIHSWLTEKLA